jgi:hypothetical protein
MSKEKVENIDRWENLLKLLTDEIEVDGMYVHLKDDFEKFYIKGNKTAGTRIRKVMQLIRREAEQIRIEVQEHKKTI